MSLFIERWVNDPLFQKIILAVLAVVLIVIFIRIIQRMFGRYIQDTNTRYRARKIMTFVGYFLGAFFLATIFADRLGGLNIALGVAGAGIAFALQEVIVSIAGWFVIVFSHFFKTGDRIKLGGVKGDVIDVGILRTTVMEMGEWVDGDLYNGRVVRVANSFVFKEPVYNYSGEFPFLWDEITIPIRHGSDPALTRQLLQTVVERHVREYAEYAKQSWVELVRKFRIEDASVAPLITMTLDANWMTFTIRYVVDYRLRRSTKDKLFTDILDEIGKSDGRVNIASTSMDVTLIPATDESATI